MCIDIPWGGPSGSLCYIFMGEDYLQKQFMYGQNSLHHFVSLFLEFVIPRIKEYQECSMESHNPRGMSDSSYSKRYSSSKVPVYGHFMRKSLRWPISIIIKHCQKVIGLTIQHSNIKMSTSQKLGPQEASYTNLSFF